jgi:hypothetical protein
MALASHYIAAYLGLQESNCGSAPKPGFPDGFLFGRRSNRDTFMAAPVARNSSPRLLAMKL